MKVVRQSGPSKNLARRIVTSFIGNKYETNTTTVFSGVKFSFTFVNQDTHMR